MYGEIPPNLRLTLLSCDGIPLLTDVVFDQVASTSGSLPSIDLTVFLDSATATAVWPLLFARFYAVELGEWHLTFEAPLPPLTLMGVLQELRLNDTPKGPRLALRIGTR